MWAIVCAILAGLCWGVGEIYTKSAINTRQVGPMGTAFVRAAVTLPLALLAVGFAQQVLRSEPGGWWREMSRETWLKLILGSGLLAGFGGVFFFYLGLSLPGGDISKLRPIAFALAPATAVFLGYWILGEPLTARKLVAVALILAGIVLLTGDGKAHASTGNSTPASAPMGGTPG